MTKLMTKIEEIFQNSTASDLAAGERPILKKIREAISEYNKACIGEDEDCLEPVCPSNELRAEIAKRQEELL